MNFSASLLQSNSCGCGHDPVSSFTHLVGAVWFAILAKPLLQKAEGRWGQKAALAIYASSCVLLLFISGIYHWLPPGLGRDFMRRMDVAAIFLLIAGTFTPICAMAYRGATRWGSLITIWTIAIIGILLRTLYFDSISGRLGTEVFLGFGWLGGILAFDLWHRESFAFIKPLLLGGAAYTVGAVILELGKSLSFPTGMTAHDIWHLAVLLGIAWHWRFIGQVAENPCQTAEPLKPCELAQTFNSAYTPAKT